MVTRGEEKAEVTETVKRILDDLAARIALGDRYDRAPDTEREAVAELHRHTLDGAIGMIETCLERASQLAISAVHRALHKSTVDPLMLDEAVHYADVEEGENDG